MPRWRLSCYWRKDKIPIWRNDDLLADDTHDYGFGVNDALQFIKRLSERLKVNPEYIIPGYEDVFYYLWKEGTLPSNIDPLKSDLKDPLERQYLTKLLDRNLGEPAGYVLPIGWDLQRQMWRSNPWYFRRENLFLIPGGSVMGFRLPLESLPWVSPEKREVQPERSPFEDFPPIGDFHAKPAKISNSTSANRSSEDETALITTALCLEARDGRLHVFMPPLTHLEHFLELVAEVEKTAVDLSMPILLEGYDPPQDHRSQKLMVTPDPGVIEVNIHPARSWDELVRNTTILYEQARLARLCAEKFMLDGRHTGTGGGNHVVLGGPTPAESPMLRRPDLLLSLITYWQNHPGLSYFFSGLFIGPTSQAPRVDEGRDDYLYEIEIAFQQMPEREVVNLWLVDRLLRNLLVDLTGNTHRSEFCIDKLFSPDTESDRQGLVELRAFEMPPHSRMSLVQMLLVRSLIAWFWRKPYKNELIHWGTQLHDRFMQPHHVLNDMKEVTSDLNRAGYPFKREWLIPFYEFRFPPYGEVNVHGIRLELRYAIEPWHVLGEEETHSGAARFVDSSVERLQVKASGLTDTRHIVTCNKRRLVLHNTGVHGEYVAGLRYRAWQPPSALHPLIRVHSPLVFDIIDTWNGRSIGGCSYHVSHRGGRHYETFPVNAYKAEASRITRFWNHGHTPGPFQPPPIVETSGEFIPEGHPPGPMASPEEEVNPEYPHTLDLRKK